MKAPLPGDAPPADAKWEKINVPSEQNLGDEKLKGVHCAWFRKTIDAPAYIAGERIMFRCGELLSVAKVYLNGQTRRRHRPRFGAVRGGHHGRLQAGQKNDILIAAQDWLAYSPKNLDRVLHGEEPIFKDGMLNVADYDAGSMIGIRGRTWLETRPAVSVDDVFITTSVRQKKITIRYELVNTGRTDQEDVTVAPVVLDEGQVAKTLPPQRSHDRGRSAQDRHLRAGLGRREAVVVVRSAPVRPADDPHAARGGRRRSPAAIRIPRVLDRRDFLLPQRHAGQAADLLRDGRHRQVQRGGDLGAGQTLCGDLGLAELLHGQSRPATGPHAPMQPLRGRRRPCRRGRPDGQARNGLPPAELHARQAVLDGGQRLRAAHGGPLQESRLHHALERRKREHVGHHLPGRDRQDRLQRLAGQDGQRGSGVRPATPPDGVRGRRRPLRRRKVLRPALSARGWTVFPSCPARPGGGRWTARR